MMIDTSSDMDRQSLLLLAALIALSLVGVLSLTLSPVASLAPPGLDPELFRWLSLVQPAILTIPFALLGHALAQRVGLDAPLLRALVEGRRAMPIFQRQIAPALLGGVLAGFVLVAYLGFVSGDAPAKLDMPLATKLLYGGVTEEVMARWGLMTLGVWTAARLSGAGDRPQAVHYWCGNLFAAILFAAGHLPVLFAVQADVSSALVAAVLLGNMVPALVFGWLFRTRGLEAAIMAHMAAHLVGAAYLAAV